MGMREVLQSEKDEIAEREVEGLSLHGSIL